MQASTREDADFQHEAQRHARAHASLSLDRSGILIRTMSDPDLERVLELRKTVRWSADPRTFGLLREMKEARWAIAEDGPAVVGYGRGHAARGGGHSLPSRRPPRLPQVWSRLRAILLGCLLLALLGREGRPARLDAWGEEALRIFGLRARLEAQRIPPGGRHSGSPATGSWLSRRAGRADARGMRDAAPVRRPARAIRCRSLGLRRGSFCADPGHPQPAPWLGTNRPGCLGTDERLPRPQRLQVHCPDRHFHGLFARRRSRPACARPPDRQRPLRRGLCTQPGRKSGA